MPLTRAASNTLVPAGMRTTAPSIVNSTSPGLIVVLIWFYLPRHLRDLCALFSVPSVLKLFLSFHLNSGTNTNAHQLSHPTRLRKTNATRTLAVQYVPLDFSPKMLQNREHWRRDNLSQPTDRRQTHRRRQFVDQSQVRAEFRLAEASTRPTRQQFHHFLRAAAARHAFPAGFIAIKAHSVQGHVQHAG